MRSTSDPGGAGLPWPPSAEERALAAALREVDRQCAIDDESRWSALESSTASLDDGEVDGGSSASRDGHLDELDDVAVIESILTHGVDPWSLALLTSIDPEALLDPIHRVQYLQALDCVQSFVAARQQRALVAVAGRHSSGDLRTERHVEHEVAIARRSTRGRAGREIELARTLRTEFRDTAVALERGELGLEHASALVVGTRHVARAEARAEVERRVLSQAASTSPRQFRAHVDAAVCAVDAEDETRRHARARGDRQVWVRRVENGLGELVVIDAWSVVSGMYERITGSARDLQRERRASQAPDLDAWADCSLDNCRADALADLVLADETDDEDLDEADDEADPEAEPDAGHVCDRADAGRDRRPRPRRHRRGRPRIEGHLVIDLATLRGEQDNPCLLDGSPVPAPVGRRLARDISHWRRMVTDPVEGHLLDYGRRVYLPSRLRTFVLARDRTCRNPWCDQPAQQCDMDHANEFPEGPSSSANTGPFCKDCHRIKTARGAFLDDSAADGSGTWRTAWGQTVAIRPTRFLDDGGASRVGPSTIPGMLDRDVDHPAPRAIPRPDDPGDEPPF